MFENKVKTLLAAGAPVWGASLAEPSTLMAKLTVNTGVDFLWIETEHMPFSPEDCPMVPIICRLKDCVPVVRVAGLDPVLIKKALDVGASGIMIPQVNTAEEARLAVQYTKYPPEGSRGVSPTWTIYMDVSYQDYLPFANKETLVIVQIETPEGIKNLEEIAAVPGVDVVFAGPLDLSAAFGHIGQIEHPEVQKFLEDLPPCVARVGKWSGITLLGAENAKKAYQQGYRFINIGNLLRLGALGLSADLKFLREWVKGQTAGSAQYVNADFDR
jgi:4-hydroxy-2-oxoheptanedioate aldolase